MSNEYSQYSFSLGTSVAFCRFYRFYNVSLDLCFPYNQPCCVTISCRLGIKRWASSAKWFSIPVMRSIDKIRLEFILVTVDSNVVTRSPSPKCVRQHANTLTVAMLTCCGLAGIMFFDLRRVSMVTISTECKVQPRMMGVGWVLSWYFDLLMALEEVFHVKPLCCWRFT